MPSERVIRFACQIVVLVWIAAVLGWRELAPREVRVPIQTSAFSVPADPEPAPEARLETPPEAEPERPPEAEPEPPTEAEPERADEPAPEPMEVADLPEVPEPDAAVREPALPEPPSAPPVEPAERVANAVPEPPRETRAAEEPAAPADVSRARVPAPAVPEPDVRELAVQTVAEADVARGSALLTGDGGFPVLESRYESFGSFREYARAMQGLGARFVVVERRAILGTIDPWTLQPGELRDAASLSPRARDYAGEPALLAAGRTVRQRHGRRAEIMMLVPRRIDAALFGGIARALAVRGQDPSAYRQILARYERGPGGTLHLRVETAVGKDGHEEPLPLLFDLRRLVSA